MSKGRSVPSFCVDGSSSLRKGDARVSEFGFGNEGEGGSPSGFPFRIALHEEVASTNDEVKRALVVGLECFDMWRTSAGLDLVGPRYFGIDTDYIPVEERSARKGA